MKRWSSFKGGTVRSAVLVLAQQPRIRGHECKACKRDESAFFRPWTAPLAIATVQIADESDVHGTLVHRWRVASFCFVPRRVTCDSGVLGVGAATHVVDRFNMLNISRSTWTRLQCLDQHGSACFSSCSTWQPTPTLYPEFRVPSRPSSWSARLSRPRFASR